MAYSTSIADNAHQSVAGQKRTANVEQSTSLLSNLMGETTVTQRWVVSYKRKTFTFWFCFIIFKCVSLSLSFK